MQKSVSPKPMIVPGRYSVKYFIELDGSYRVESVEPYNKEKYRSGEYVFNHITVSGIDELDAYKTALDIVKKKTEDFREFLDGFTKPFPTD